MKCSTCMPQGEVAPCTAACPSCLRPTVRAPSPPRPLPLHPLCRSAGTACTVWEAALEDLLPYLLENPRVLDVLCCRAQRQREELAAQVQLQREAAEAGVAGTYGLDPAPPAQGQAQPAAPAVQADVGSTVGPPLELASAGGAAAGPRLWTVSAAGVTAEPSATQLPGTAAADGSSAGGGPAADSAGVGTFAAPTDVGAPATTGECHAGKRVPPGLPGAHAHSVLGLASCLTCRDHVAAGPLQARWRACAGRCSTGWRHWVRRCGVPWQPPRWRSLWRWARRGGSAAAPSGPAPRAGAHGGGTGATAS